MTLVGSLSCKKRPQPISILFNWLHRKILLKKLILFIDFEAPSCQEKTHNRFFKLPYPLEYNFDRKILLFLMDFEGLLCQKKPQLNFQSYLNDNDSTTVSDVEQHFFVAICLHVIWMTPIGIAQADTNIKR